MTVTDKYNNINVPNMVTKLDAENGNCTWKFTDSGQARAGDIAVENGNDYADASNPKSNAQAHIGICMNTGCTEIDSNSSSKGMFMNNFHDPNFGNPASQASTFYRIYC